MAVLFLDGADHYAATDTLLKYTAVTWNTMQTGLLGVGQCGRLNGAGPGPRKALTSAVTTIIVGVRFRTGSLPAGAAGIFALLDGSNNIIGNVCVSNTGSLGWYRGNAATAVCVSSGALIASNAINFIEVKVTLATGATGTVDVHLNGTSVCSASSVQTANTTASASSVQWNAPGSPSDFDDMYVFDNTGSFNNNFAGDVKITTVKPSGAGRVTQWTPLSGTNWSNVSEVTPDGDTSYVSSSTAGQIDAYTLGPAGGPSSLFAVQINTDVRKDDANTRTVAHGVGNGTTENFDAGTNVGAAYGYLIRPLDSNPLTSAGWAAADLTTLQSAIKCIA